MDGKASTADLVSKGQHFAHELAEGANTGNINFRLFKIDNELNSITNPAQRQQVLAAMDKELSDKGLLPSAMQVFAEQKDNHDILRADRRGMHADTLAYNLNPQNAYNASKLKHGSFSAEKTPVEMMLTADLALNADKISKGELKYGRIDDWVKRNEGIPGSAKYAAVAPAPETMPADAPSAAGKKDAPPASKTDASNKEADNEKAEAKAAQAIKDKDTHTVKPGETLRDIAIAELKAEGKIAENASARDLALAHKQIAYEEHLIRLYTPKIFEHLPNYNGKLQSGWSLNLVPDKEMQKELDDNKAKYHPQHKGA